MHFVVMLLLPCEGPSLTLRSLNWCQFVRRCPLKTPCGVRCRRVLEREKHIKIQSYRHVTLPRCSCMLNMWKSFFVLNNIAWSHDYNNLLSTRTWPKNIFLPWQRSTYSGRFLMAVCTTSKLPLPIQYMKVGRKSVARLQDRKHTLLYSDK